HHEHDAEQRQSASPSNGKQIGEMVGNVALLELVRQQLEPDKQKQQVGHDHSLVFGMGDEGTEARASREFGHERFEQEDGEQPANADFERALVEQRDAEQQQAEQDEFDWNAEQVDHRVPITAVSAEVCPAAPPPFVGSPTLYCRAATQVLVGAVREE